jgi:hypothetical protein
MSKRCGDEAAQEAGIRTLKAVTLADSRTLFEAMLALPTHRDVFRWQEYLDAYLPLLDTLLEAKRRRKLRVNRLWGYNRRNHHCDVVIKELLGGSLSTERRKETLVAYGDAAIVSTGFGYPPVSHKRLRYRLQVVHKIRLLDVDEFRTSMVCNKCHAALLYEGKDEKGPLWALRVCPHCLNPAGTGPKFWQRDRNAALNIEECALAFLRDPACRPAGLARSNPAKHFAWQDLRNKVPKPENVQVRQVRETASLSWLLQ